jgi:hypothetical protein
MNQYEDIDDFSITHIKPSGAGKKKRKDKNQGSGSCYNSKHIRLQEAKKENSKGKKPNNTNSPL